MSETSSPLTEVNLQEINDALSRIDTLEFEIKRAESAGIEQPGQLDNVREKRKQFLALKAAYFPNQ